MTDVPLHKIEAIVTPDSFELGVHRMRVKGGWIYFSQAVPFSSFVPDDDPGAEPADVERVGPHDVVMPQGDARADVRPQPPEPQAHRFEPQGEALGHLGPVERAFEAIEERVFHHHPAEAELERAEEAQEEQRELDEERVAASAKAAAHREEEQRAADEPQPDESRPEGHKEG